MCVMTHWNVIEREGRFCLLFLHLLADTGIEMMGWGAVEWRVLSCCSFCEHNPSPHSPSMEWLVCPLWNRSRNPTRRGMDRGRGWPHVSTFVLFTSWNHGQRWWRAPSHHLHLKLINSESGDGKPCPWQR